MPELTAPVDALRHVLVTLSYRFEHALEGAPEGFAAFATGADVRTPVELVRHLAGLMRFADALWTGAAPPAAPDPGPWADEVAAFRHELRAFDATLRRLPAPAGGTAAHRVLQGPLIDAATHVGQLVTLRRLAGAPVERRRFVPVDMPELDPGAGGGR
jgi:hypothetical protein